VPVLTDPFGWFTVEIPEGWGMCSEDCVTVLQSPRGVGLVYLSAARHARGRQPSFGGADFLSRFLQSLGLEVGEEAIRHSVGLGCRIYSYRRETGIGHWSFWSVTDDETALLICYASADAEGTPPEVEREDVEVSEMVQSVRLYHSGTN
jgi:hypothetical protein